MIGSSRQLKDKVRNISDGNSNKATMLIRNFMMERFLERVSLSSYRDNFILKGGMLVASIIGIDMRATMDIDTTVKSLPLNETVVQRIIEEICSIELEDNVRFQIKSTRTIMEEFEYPGIRVMLEAILDRMHQPIKIDISTDDAITPGAVKYDYKLMFENRTISVLTYNKETLLAEKIQTIINRGIANTRLRDFYDVYSIMNLYGEQIQQHVLYDAFCTTCEKRRTVFSKDDIIDTLNMISDDLHMEELWEQFRKSNFFVGDIDWKSVIDYIGNAINNLYL